MLVPYVLISDAYHKILTMKKSFEKTREQHARRVEKAQKKNEPVPTLDLDVEKYKRLITESYLNIISGIEEFRFIEYLRNAVMITARDLQETVLIRLRNAATLKDLISVCNIILEPFENFVEDYGATSLNDYSYQYSFRGYYGNNYSNLNIADDALEMIRDAIAVRRPVNVLDLTVREGDNAVAFKADREDVKLYAYDVKKQVWSRSNFERIIYGVLPKCYITRECFDIVLLVPKPQLSLSHIKNKRLEKELLSRSTNYLRPGGVLVLALPYFRYTQDLCAILAKEYQDFQVFTTPKATERNGTQHVYLVAKKKAHATDITPDDYNFLREIPIRFWKMIDELPTPTELNPVTLPDKQLVVEYFRGSEFSEEEMEELYDTSRCVAQFWQDQKIEILSQDPKRPLLPFNVGQLGLVLTSGCLDGVIEEGDGYSHVVRGRIIKKVDNVEDVDEVNNSVKVISTTSNRVEINVFLPDGTYKSLC